MSAIPSSAPVTTAPVKGLILLPAARFFVRRVTLVAGQDVVAQVELALETIGPFTPGQLYYGYCLSRDGTQALVFAAYRRNFPAADTATWSTASAVLPEFAVWLSQTATVPAGIWLHEHGQMLTAIVWDGAGELPAGVLSREAAVGSIAGLRDDLLREAGIRFGVAAQSPRTFQGNVAAIAQGKEGLTLKVAQQSTLLSPAQLRAMDVRDKTELAGQLGRHKRDRALWLAFASAVVGLAACVVAESGLQVSNLFAARQRHRLESNAAAVRQIEEADQLAARMENFARQSLRPFEMLVVLNGARPASLEFVRASTLGPRQMELEAQTANAADPQDYEKALKGDAGVEKVELRDLRTSGGKTTFMVAVTFKSGFGGPGGTR